MKKQKIRFISFRDKADCKMTVKIMEEFGLFVYWQKSDFADFHEYWDCLISDKSLQENLVKELFKDHPEFFFDQEQFKDYDIDF